MYNTGQLKCTFYLLCYKYVHIMYYVPQETGYMFKECTQNVMSYCIYLCKSMVINVMTSKLEHVCYYAGI